ncbi:MAG: HAMP domain-containing protein, partial [Anaerolineae bacterium]|nr:HAMP domain-containing protein [Anaerolineae bacterium]
MALRARLTLFYTSILGVVLALFGSAVYVLVSVVLIRQVDETLESAINDVLRLTMVDPQGQLFSTSELSLNENIVIQAWDTRGSSIGSTESFNPLSSLIFPLDPEGLKVSEPTFSEVQIGDSHLRVLSVPVVFEDEALGTFQAGTNLKPVDNVRTNLLQALLALGFLGLSVSALAGWLSTGRALAPLATMTRTALQITRADDLSRRIPQDNLVEDEVGLLVQAFNQTLGRMENLFESQRRFIADVGHELRTPLTVMKGNVDLLRRMPEQSEESLRSIEGEVDRLTRLVEDLLLLVYADTGKLPLNSTPLELDTLLLEIYQQARVLAGEKATVRIG